jgi:hypothetical protein
MSNVVNVGWRAVLQIMAKLAFVGCFVLGLADIRHVYAQAAEAGHLALGKGRAEQRMLSRLVEIAEGPPPTMESLAAEFGFIYQKAPNYSEGMQDYYATGSFPFNVGLAADYLHMPARTLPAMLDMPARPLPESVDISFKFITRQGEFSPYCITTDDLKSLLNANWKLHVKTVQPHSLHVEGYTKASGGYDRSASMTPTLPGCITEFRVTYERAAMPVEPNARPTRSTTQGGKKMTTPNFTATSTLFRNVDPLIPRNGPGFAALLAVNLFIGADAAWSSVKVWGDGRHDGKTEAGELKTFAYLGIAAINIATAGQSGEMRDGNGYPPVSAANDAGWRTRA